jgi:hypothetical protein
MLREARPVPILSTGSCCRHLIISVSINILMLRGKIFLLFLRPGKNIEDYEAIKLYNEWALTLRNNISTEQSSTLEGIGVLKRDMTGEVVFEPENPSDMLSIPVPAQRIVRTNAKHTMLVGDKEVSNVEMKDFLHDEIHREKTSWWIYALIIGAIALPLFCFISSEVRMCHRLGITKPSRLNDQVQSLSRMSFCRNSAGAYC